MENGGAVIVQNDPLKRVITRNADGGGNLNVCFR
jgi:hypothetical protein